MPIKTSSGKWKWGNVERSSKKELVQTVYGIWKKNGSKGSFSDFWHGKHVNEHWGTGKNKDYFFCDDCNKNMTKAPDDQYIMIDDDLWEYVCKHGGKKLVPDKDVLCRDCIEKRLGRPLTLKDLGDKINLPINDEIKKMIKKRKVKESVVSEDKAAMIKKLVLPDIEDEDEKKNYKWIIQGFFYKHPSYEKEIDWNKWKTLTKKDFDKVMALADNSRKARKEKERMGFGKDPKNLFKNVKGRKFKIVDENDSWLFVAPLNYEAAVFCDSKECGGGSATWCIGTRNNSSYWNKYVSAGSKFIMAFSKKFETMPEKNLFTDLKYMFQKEDDSTYLIWDQSDIDEDAATKVNETRFKKNLQQFKTLFSKVKDGEYRSTVFSWKDGDKESGVIERILLGSKHYLKFAFPKETIEIDSYATEDDGNQYDAEIDEIIFNDSLKGIGAGAFARIDVKKISYSDNCNLEYIDIDAFRGNPSIEELDLSRLKNPLSIGAHAFAYCRYLKTVRLPPSIDELGYDIFDGCKSLRYIEIPRKFFDAEDDFEVLAQVCGEIEWEDVKIVPIDEHGKKIANESYERPYSLDTIKQKYGDETYNKLKDDPVHKWRAETGIELIHHEPTKEEFERIVKNWNLMSDEDKKKSDEKSIEIFGRDNKDRIELLRKEYDFKVGDRVTVRKGLRCRQSGHSGEIIRVNLPEDHDYDSHGFSSFTIEMDDPNLGITSFQSGAIEKEMTNEAYEIHGYPEKLQSTLERIVKDNEDYELDRAYFNKEGKFIWMRNSKGYFHIFKPVKLKNMKWKPYALKDMILQDDGMMKTIDTIQFENGQEAIKFLQQKYKFDKKSMSL